MAKEYSAAELEALSQEDLIKLEDEAVAEEAGEAVDPVTTPEPTVTQPEIKVEVKTEDKPVKTEVAEKVEVKPTETPEAETIAPVVPAVEEPVIEDDEKAHISPPSKWAEQRREKRELKARADEAEEIAKAASATEQENKDLKAKLEWMTTAISAKGVDLPESPLDTFSPEKIEEVRTEFGDELADMLQGAATILKTQQINAGTSVTAQAKAEPAKVVPDVAVPAVETQQEVDQSLFKAIDDNDELSYWKSRAEDPTNPNSLLWDRAIAKDNDMLKDPAFARLSYDDRFKMVVEAVKKDVMSTALPTKTTEPSGAPDASMGSGGIAPVPDGNSPVDKILAATPDNQTKLYNLMSQADKDLVDMALNI